jgi:hypothetical protein
VDELLKAINKFPNGTKLIINWKNGVEIEGKIDTIYETNNGLEMDDEGYQEYYACAFNVLAIKSPLLVHSNLEVGGLIEVSMQDPPLSVISENGAVIWKNNK